jgi:hypothetical protein
LMTSSVAPLCAGCQALPMKLPSGIAVPPGASESVVILA